jgi:acyl transferase domain-containing protein
MTSVSNQVTDIAVIGMACRFPDARNPDEFWVNLRSGRECVAHLSSDEIAAAGVDSALIHHPEYVKAGVLLADIEEFDAEFFGFNPREAEITDPQHRLFLECAWEAFENAGYVPGSHLGRAAVYASAGMNTYLIFNLYGNREMRKSADRLAVMVGNDKDFLATRVAYKLNLTGPSITVQTACSSSLVAVHLACQSLLSRECDLALAGGAAIRVPQKSGYLYQPGAIFSPDGHCRAFDAQATGTIFGSGVGAVLLKPLAKALADRDNIHAVIKGSAINNDGSAKVGFTAPSVDAQSEVIAEAQAMAAVEAETIGFVEAHGTGTEMGDPIEIAALTQAFRRGTNRNQFCAIGSVKTNFGHLDVAAGVAGLMKTVLCLQKKQLVPNLHFTQPNPKIAFEATPFYVNTGLQDWRKTDSPRRAGVSSFGIGGTNAHVVLEEAPEMESDVSSRNWQLLTITSKTEAALASAVGRWADWLEEHPEASLAQAAYTSHVGRKHFQYRFAVVCRDSRDGIQRLRERGLGKSSVPSASTPRIAFLFPGQGAQRVNMGGGLYRTEPEFRNCVDCCSEILKLKLNHDLRDVMYAYDSCRGAVASHLNQTEFAQPALFVTEFALARLLMSLGVQPDVMLGHSVGEYVAACLADVLSLEDALTLLALRGKLMQSLPRGAMLAVMLSEPEVVSYLPSDLSVAAVNGPQLSVISGPENAILSLEKRLVQQHMGTKRLHTSHAFHSAMMDPILEQFASAVSRISLRAPKVRYISNLTGKWITASQAKDPQYWAMHMRHCVRFDAGLVELLKNSETVALEVGPGQGLSDLARARTLRAISTTSRSEHQTEDQESLLQALGKLWTAGAQIDWEAFHSQDRVHRTQVPTYPFERKRYWIDAKPVTEREEPDREHRLEKNPDLDRWFYMPVWKRSSMLSSRVARKSNSVWLLLCDELGVGAALREAFTAAGDEVFVAHAGESFERFDSHTFAIPAGTPGAYHDLLRSLGPAGDKITNAVHLWGIGKHNSDSHSLEGSQKFGFESLLLLMQALGLQAPPRAVDLTVVSSGLHEITGDEPLHPVNVTAIGACLVIPQEYPNFTCRCIDLDERDLESAAGLQRVVDQLRREFREPGENEVIGYRGRHRWLRDFDSVVVRDTPLTLRSHGTYLITGGLGGVGCAIAEYLAKETRANLVLVGRSALPPEKDWDAHSHFAASDDTVRQRIAAVRKCRQLGAEVLVLQADVTNPEEMRRALKVARGRFGEIHGVIHAAGVAGGGLMQGRALKDVRAVVAPKVRGALVLDELLREDKLDFFLLCSSINAVVGGPGQSDYCAANAFLDAFAHERMRRSGDLTVSVNWDTWSETGMAVAASKQIAGLASISGRIDSAPTMTDEDVHSRPVTSSDWFLHEHRILNAKPVMPGTMFLHLAARAVAARTGHGGTIGFSDVFFLSPMVVEGPVCDVRTIMRAQGPDFRFEVRSGQHGHLHAVGTVRMFSSPSVDHHNIGQIRERCAQRSDPSDEQRREIAGLGFGPRWHSLRRVHLGNSEMLAEIELPQQFENDLAEYNFHPALLDVATGFGRFYLDSKETYLPLSYQRIDIVNPIPSRFYSHVTAIDRASTEELISYNVTLLDDDGMVLAMVTDFTLKKLDTVWKAGPDRFDPFARRMSTQVKPALELALRTGMTTAEALGSFRRLLAANVGPQVIVSPKALDDVRHYAASLDPLIQSGQTMEQSYRGVASEAPRHERPQQPVAYREPQTNVQRQIVSLWEEALGIIGIGIDDDFFALGGDSVLAIQIVARARQAGLELSPQQLFGTPTVAGLAAHISEKKGIAVTDGEGERQSHPTMAPFALSGLSSEELDRVSMIADEIDSAPGP